MIQVVVEGFKEFSGAFLEVSGTFQRCSKGGKGISN